MSLTTALASALSGLTAAARQAEALSSNVANASTPGYARRVVSLSASVTLGHGQGVKVNRILREVDAFLLNNRMMAQAAASHGSTAAGFLARLEGIFGDAGSESSLLARADAFASSLLGAMANPASVPGLTGAINAASYLVRGLREASLAIQNERIAADRSIASAVANLNAALEQVQLLNTAIAAGVGGRRDVSALLDQRTQVIESIAELVPVRELARPNGQVALVTTGGAILLDGRAASFGFAATAIILPDMTLENGALSGLTLNGNPITTSGPRALIGGGELAALFAIRDESAVTGQARLDAVARDLVERFADPALDPTRPAAAPGLFTDGGAVFDPLNEVGLSGRISLNALVDPERGGLVQRLRDGLGSSGTGPDGNTALLVALQKGLDAARPTASPTLEPGARSFNTLLAEVVSLTSVARLAAENQQAYAVTRLTALQDLERAGTVDIDAEMQHLMAVEKAYAANAKVLQTIDELLTILLGIG